MLKIGLIACCATKQKHPCIAREMYISPLFRSSVEYLQTRTSEWVVLSAKHGVVKPSQFITPYNETLDRMSKGERDRWGAMVSSQLRQLFPRDTFLAMGGSNYLDALQGLTVEDFWAPYKARHNANVRAAGRCCSLDPFSHGYRLSILNKLLRRSG